MNARLLTLSLLIAATLLADGSHILLHQQVTPFDITLFAPENRMTTGQTDLTVMVQNAADHSDVSDAHVTLRFEKNEAGKILELVAPATHGKATNKMLYGTTVSLPSEGVWKFTADVEAQGKSVVVADKLDVGPAQPPLSEKWPLIVFVPVAIVLFIINRRLKRRWRPTYPRAQS